MTPQKVYSRSEIDTMGIELSSKAILRKFLSPGMVFDPPPYSTRQLRDIPTTNNHEPNDELARIRTTVQARVCNAFADNQPIYGIPVRTDLNLWQRPKGRLCLPEIVRNAVIDHFYTQRGMEKPATRRIPPEQTECQFTIVPYLGVDNVENPPTESFDHFNMSLPQMEEIGMDVERLAETIGDALAIFVFKSGYNYYGDFSFSNVPDAIDEPNRSWTIGLCVSHLPSAVMQRQPGLPFGNGDEERMAKAMEQQVPSPVRSIHLWKAFKTAFIARGKKYHSAVPDVTPEEMMSGFEKIYCSSASDEGVGKRGASVKTEVN
ncbi:unnamed protein product [Fusarium graminearum]|uniref:Chromosome 4, complete genome n=2 Tax=Gibberella zeae (strain ATCC MYA-4620 / CBS 123657 / FGSC 9075 / NRRL 31084 / PH-1) TaxID=229533 RepID=A0A0E0SC81_GIBZE|nr:hypothetical protein FG05_07876 [Fusarium graminearum]CAF3523338.1 unnamed protein product [Fusarium graminearum]CEF84044.1 unnamed protein product [Fusarium graminearum]